MLKKKSHPSATDTDIDAEDEHAYEGAWYRSLKARAAHRAKDASEHPKHDEPQAPGEEPAAG